MRRVTRPGRFRLVVAVAAGVVAVAGAAVAVPAARAATTAGCGRAPTLATGTHTIQSSGQNRTYILDVPSGYDSNHPYRLIFALHWLNGTANDVATGGSDGAVFAY